MQGKEIVASAALERILSSYGFKQQKELAEHLGIHGNNVSSWLARNTIPSNVFLECALDTGANLHWLCYGEFANASIGGTHASGKGKALYDEIMSNGGKPVLRRIMDAYGFTTQKQLCDLLGISSGTVSTWVRRDFFPGDVVVTCALDTGVSIEWLATGNKTPAKECSSNIISLKKFRIDSGRLENSGDWAIDHSLLAGNYINNYIVEKNNNYWLVDFDDINIRNGYWLISIDGSHDIYQVLKLPGSRLRIIAHDHQFECGESDVQCVGKVKYSILNDI